MTLKQSVFPKIISNLWQHGYTGCDNALDLKFGTVLGWYSKGEADFNEDRPSTESEFYEAYSNYKLALVKDGQDHLFKMVVNNIRGVNPDDTLVKQQTSLFIKAQFSEYTERIVATNIKLPPIRIEVIGNDLATEKGRSDTGD